MNAVDMEVVFLCLLLCRPRLGDSLFKVVAAGVAYFSLALVDGIMRSRAVSLGRGCGLFLTVG